MSIFGSLVMKIIRGNYLIDQHPITIITTQLFLFIYSSQTITNSVLPIFFPVK